MMALCTRWGARADFRAVLSRLGLLCLCVLHSGLARAANWPMIPMPPNVSAFAVGEQITANGLPMRVQGFVSKDLGVPALADWFRRSLGQPLVESRLGNKLILGRAQDGYYLSVQLESAGLQGSGGSKGLLAVTDIAGMNQNREREATAQQSWLQRWPSGTQVLSRMSSQDNGRTSLHVALRNGHSESLNRAALVDAMKQEGLALEREVSADARTIKAMPGGPLGGTSLFFKGNGKEAMAMMARDGQGRTAIVLNTTTAITAYPQ